MIDSQAFNQQLHNTDTHAIAQTLSQTKTYLFYGQTPFLSEENAQNLVTVAKAHGFAQRDIFYLDNRAKCQPIINAMQSPGLFDPKKIIELRFDTDKPTKKIGEQVATLAAHNSTNLLIIQAGNLAYKTQKEKWFTRIQQLATTVIAKPVYANQLPHWIHQRAEALGIQLHSDALKKVMHYSQGNLLWTNQILMQLSHSDYPRHISEEIIEDILADLSVFKIDDLTRALLAKDSNALNITKKLEQENESLVYIVSVLSREFDTVLQILQSGQSFQNACKQLRIWQSKQRLYQSAVNHYDHIQCQTFLRALAEIDKTNKGLSKNDGWLQLTHAISTLVIANVFRNPLPPHT